MKALILNSGLGSRMGILTSDQPKCMTEVAHGETILSRQLTLISAAGIDEAVITTGLYDAALVEYCASLALPIKLTFVNNPEYRSTNYIYSMYLAKAQLEDQDVLLMHGDLVFEPAVLDDLLASDESCMVVSSTLPLPDKDFKSVIQDGRIRKIGIEFFEDAVASQALYHLKQKEWRIWMDSISAFCERGDVKCYAENAFNAVSDVCVLRPLDVRDRLCAEIDTPEDLSIVSKQLDGVKNRTVYMCFSTDMIHSGHISIVQKAAKLGKLTVGVLSDHAIMSYKRFPLIPFEDRRMLLKNIAGVSQVVEQQDLSYRQNLEQLRPDYVVHGDDWQSGFQKPIRDEVLSILATYGGQLVDYPYTHEERYIEIERRARAELSLPDVRRSRLKKALAAKGLVSVMEAHSGLTGLIVEDTCVHVDGKTYQFDGMWISSLCDSTAKGKPDIELVDMTSRFRTIDDIMEVTTKPIIFDGDTGGLTEHFVYTVKTLERMGVSMVIIEDKTGLKKNSLFGTEADQTQDDIESFSAKIAAGKSAQKSKDFMICARIESLILERGMEDALKRAYAFVAAGADAIMIHSRRKDPAEIFEFVDTFRARDAATPIVVVPTSFNAVTEDEFKARGVNMVIYANQLTRAGFPAMKHAAELILENHRAKECDDICMSFKDIITLIPDDR
ncbi:phosphoenolpyruvate mutase [Eubacteriales bacterium OttesenSCG-928-N13]|nr:phosphoenolpyruvate mutase [Eubacteriales bacterium OttesenSCG-928-N13]